jgi:hypothetical protein
MFTVAGSVLWSACSVTAVVCSVLAARRPRAVRAGRIAVGVLVLVGGALFNAVQLAQGNDYAGFADPSPFPWIARTWRAVVPPHHVLLIGLLVVFEAAVGLLVLGGGRGTRLGYGGAIAFHLLLWPFGWFELGYSLLMLPAPALLLRAERRGTAPAGPATGPAADRPRAGAGPR